MRGNWTTRILILLDRACTQSLTLRQLYEEWPEGTEVEPYLERVFDDLEEYLEHYSPEQEGSGTLVLRLHILLLRQDMEGPERLRKREQILAAGPRSGDELEPILIEILKRGEAN